MSDLKTGLNRIPSGREVVRTSPTTIPRPQVAKPQQKPVDRSEENDFRRSGGVSNGEFISAFTEPSNETREWLGSPLLTSALKAVSKDIAPDGSAKSSRDQYVASVVETHLAARKQLATHLNALLRA